MTSTSTAPGATHQNTAKSGLPQLLLGGDRTPLVIGFGRIRGDGRGLTMSLGDTPRSTTAVGSTQEASGDGHQVQSMFARITRPPWSDGLAAVLVLESVLAADLVGARWVLVNRSSRGMA